MSEKATEKKLKILFLACFAMAGIIFLMVIILKIKYQETLFVTVINEKGQKILIRTGVVFEDEGNLRFLISETNGTKGKFYLSKNGKRWTELKDNNSYWSDNQSSDGMTTLIFSYVEKGNLLKSRKLSQVFCLINNSKTVKMADAEDNKPATAENQADITENQTDTTLMLRFLTKK